MQNQCDGCMAGMPLEGGLHVDSSNKPVMVCQRSRYNEGERTVCTLSDKQDFVRDVTRGLSELKQTLADATLMAQELYNSLTEIGQSRFFSAKYDVMRKDAYIVARKYLVEPLCNTK